ncbi:alpha/beta fold hydrolase [Thiofaba sp. EF100]|uniref:virulence factor family protein n=1 Tax=Thiofaba sp. EF100 TaxID=3121274 RepID=UPI00322211C8
MRRRFRIALLAGILGVGVALAAEPLPTREWGALSISLPAAGEGQGVAILFTPAAGPAGPDIEAAEALRAKGLAVALVDTGALLDWARQGEGCLDLAGVGQWLSQTLQQRLGLPEYRPAWLAGRAEGGWVVHALLAQAPEGVFAAGLSMDFTPGNPSGRPLCEVGGVGPDRRLAPDTPLHGTWRVGDMEAVSFDAARYARQAALASDRPMPEPLRGAYATQVLELLTPQASSLEGVPDLPLVEVARHSASGVLVVLYSGDGGWRDIDRRLGEALGRQGYAVVGIDTLRYFWGKREPMGVARDLDRLVRYYLEAWGLNEVVLIGYSFGANILPFAYNRLPDATRGRVRMVTLLSPELTTDFEVHLAGWLGQQATGAAAMPILPEASRIDPRRLLCVYGEQEAVTTLCAQPGLGGARLMRLPGGHHYDGDYEALARKLIEAIQHVPVPE